MFKRHFQSLQPLQGIVHSFRSNTFARCSDLFHRSYPGAVFKRHFQSLQPLQGIVLTFRSNTFARCFVQTALSEPSALTGHTPQKIYLRNSDLFEYLPNFFHLLCRHNGKKFIGAMQHPLPAYSCQRYKKGCCPTFSGFDSSPALSYSVSR